MAPGPQHDEGVPALAPRLTGARGCAHESPPDARAVDASAAIVLEVERRPSAVKLKHVPSALCVARLVLIPVLWVLALWVPQERVLFVTLLLIAFLTDCVQQTFEQ